MPYHLPHPDDAKSLLSDLPAPSQPPPSSPGRFFTKSQAPCGDGVSACHSQFCFNLSSVLLIPMISYSDLVLLPINQVWTCRRTFALDLCPESSSTTGTFSPFCTLHQFFTKGFHLPKIRLNDQYSLSSSLNFFFFVGLCTTSGQVHSLLSVFPLQYKCHRKLLFPWDLYNTVNFQLGAELGSGAGSGGVQGQYPKKATAVLMEKLPEKAARVESLCHGQDDGPACEVCRRLPAFTLWAREPGRKAARAIGMKLKLLNSRNHPDMK